MKLRGDAKMNILNKIAQPCRIIGSIGGLLAPVFVFLPFSKMGVVPSAPGGTVEEKMVSMVEAGVAGDALPILSAIAFTGLLGMFTIVIGKKHPILERTFLCISALGMLAMSLLSIFSLGLTFILPSILLLLAAIGIKKKQVAEEPRGNLR